MKKTTEEVIAALQQRHKNTVLDALGIQILSFDPQAFSVGIDVDHRHLQHAGIVHGGVYVTLAESAASVAAALQVDLAEYDVFGMEINANHLRPVREGKVIATAKPFHIGRQSMVYGIEVKDDKNNLVSISRCTLAIRKKIKG